PSGSVSRTAYAGPRSGPTHDRSRRFGSLRQRRSGGGDARGLPHPHGPPRRRSRRPGGGVRPPARVSLGPRAAARGATGHRRPRGGGRQRGGRPIGGDGGGGDRGAGISGSSPGPRRGAGGAQRGASLHAVPRGRDGGAGRGGGGGWRRASRRGPGRAAPRAARSP